MDTEEVQGTRKTNGRLMGREEILALAGKLQREEVLVPEWDARVLVRELTAAERDEFEASVVKRRGKGGDFDVVMRGLRAKLVILTVIDAKGNRIFNDADQDALSQVGAHAIDRIFSVAQRLSGLTKEDLDELAGKSGSGRPDEPATLSL
jgi:hypothetical protein